MKPQFQSDPLNSTYRWEIYLTQGHPDNKVALLEGYSKGVGFERTNKLELLLAKLTNPLLPYLDRADRIVIYQQIPGHKKDSHPELITLYHHQFELYNWAKPNFVISDFLTKYYAFRLKGELPPAADRRNNRRVSKEDYKTELNHATQVFATHDELVVFCRKHVEKYTYEGMKAWYHKHSMFQPELFEPAAKHTAPVDPTVVAQAQASVNAMHSKFTSKRP